MCIRDSTVPAHHPAENRQHEAVRFVLPILGGMVSGYGGAYSYLAGSIDAFVTREAFGAIMEARGFTDVRCEAMFPPVADIVSGTRAGESP